MSWTTRNLRERITHWPKQGNDGFGGTTFGSPQTLKARWEDRAELVLDEAGDEVRAESVVYLASDVAEGDYIYNGISNASDPTTVDGAKKVKTFQKLPDLRVNAYERRAFL